MTECPWGRSGNGILAEGALESASDAEAASTPAAVLALQVLRSYPYAVIVVRRDGSVVAHNPAAERLLGDLAPRLQAREERVVCEILDCGTEAAPLDGLSLIARVLGERQALPEIRVDLPPAAGAPAAWLTLGPVEGADDLVIAELRPGLANDRRRRTTPHWTAGPRMNVYALGRTRIESPEGPIEGQWLENRAGQILKVLIARRDRVVYPDEIVETRACGTTSTSCASSSSRSARAAASRRSSSAATAATRCAGRASWSTSTTSSATSRPVLRR
jgi:PAS domain-containing protein